MNKMKHGVVVKLEYLQELMAETNEITSQMEIIDKQMISLLHESRKQILEDQSEKEEEIKQSILKKQKLYHILYETRNAKWNEIFLITKQLRMLGASEEVKKIKWNIT